MSASAADTSAEYVLSSARCSVPLRVGSNELGRRHADPGHHAAGVSRVHAILSVDEAGGVLVSATGVNPLGVRRAGDAAWRWLGKGMDEHISPHSARSGAWQLALDRKVASEGVSLFQLLPEVLSGCRHLVR